MAALPQISEREPDVAAEPPAYPAGIGTLTTAELAECTCPDFCERDHGNE
jgi:hypothetical protein